MVRVPARKYSKLSNTRSGLPVLRVKSPNTSRYLCMYVLVLGLFTRNPGKPERVFDTLEYFRAGTHSIYDFRVRASRV